MAQGCQYPLCRSNVPPVLESQNLCALHFLRKIESECVHIRREAMAGEIDSRRKAEIHDFLFAQAQVLAQLATCGARLNDDARPCILNAFLTLINLCERLARLSRAEAEEAARAHLPPRLQMQSAAAVK